MIGFWIDCNRARCGCTGASCGPASHCVGCELKKNPLVTDKTEGVVGRRKLCRELLQHLEAHASNYALM